MSKLYNSYLQNSSSTSNREEKSTTTKKVKILKGGDEEKIYNTSDKLVMWQKSVDSFTPASRETGQYRVYFHIMLVMPPFEEGGTYVFAHVSR